MNNITSQILLNKYNKSFKKDIELLETNEKRDKIVSSNSDYFRKVSDYIKDQISSNNFYLLYQPQVTIDGKKSPSAEALFRLKSNDLTINPEIVFMLAGHFNYEEELNTLILNKICEDLTTFHQKISPDYKVSFNINPKTANEHFFQTFYETLQKYNLDPSSIGIELLESSSFEGLDPSLVQRFIDNGTSISLDDFGTGHADEKTLSSFPFTHLKFAGNLISGINKNEANQEIVSSQLRFCEQNGITPIFECVETKEELDQIRQMSNGEGLIQGYFFSRPLTPENLIAFSNQLNNQSQDETEQQ